MIKDIINYFFNRKKEKSLQEISIGTFAFVKVPGQLIWGVVAREVPNEYNQLVYDIQILYHQNQITGDFFEFDRMDSINCLTDFMNIKKIFENKDDMKKHVKENQKT